MACPTDDEKRRRDARARFSKVGYSIRQFARELGVHPTTVTEVLAGRKKGERGDAHKVAVALGLKDGVIIEDGASVLDAIRVLKT